MRLPADVSEFLFGFQLAAMNIARSAAPRSYAEDVVRMVDRGYHLEPRLSGLVAGCRAGFGG